MMKWNVPRGYSTLEEALAAECCDIASVCGPTGTHLATLRRLLTSEVQAVFAEKPLDCDPQNARKLAGKFEKKGVPVAVNFARRFEPTVRSLKAEMLAGQYGELRSITAWYGQGIINNGSHVIDLIAFLTDMRPSLSWIGPAWYDGVRNDPTVTAVLNVSGVPIHLIGCVGRDFARCEMELAFSRGVVVREEGTLAVRRRPIEESKFFNGVNVAGHGTWEASRYGEAMLRALDELRDWRVGDRLSSDILTAADSIAIAADIRDRVLSRSGAFCELCHD
jgi:predicted dehydrogenase